MCFTNSIYIFFHCLVSLYLTAIFQSSLKTRIKVQHTVAYKMSKNCLRGWSRWGRKGGGAVRMGGEERHGCRGIDASADPWNWHLCVWTWSIMMLSVVVYVARLRWSIFGAFWRDSVTELPAPLPRSHWLYLAHHRRTTTPGRTYLHWLRLGKWHQLQLRLRPRE